MSGQHDRVRAALDDLAVELQGLRYERMTVADIAEDWLDKTRGVVEAHERITRPASLPLQGVDR